METVLMKIYYPATSLSKGTGSRAPWASRPINGLADGYAHFSNKSKWLIRSAFWILASRTYIPAYVGSALAEKDVGEEKDDSGAAFPVVVFSHGLGGTRTTYSQYCGELASQGNIVLAVESRDGSGPTSTITQDDGAKRVSLVRKPLTRAYPSTQVSPCKQVVQYYRPDDIGFKAGDPELSQIGFRKEQLVMRLAEIKATLEIARRINDGEGQSIALQNRRKPKGTPDGGILMWKDRLNMSNIVMAGHSFGGATTIQALRAGDVFPFTRGILLDPWVDAIPPVPKSTDPSASQSDLPQEAGRDIDVPVLVINSEAFTVWSSHFRVVREIVRAVKADAWFSTLVGSVHLSFSDVPIILPFFAKKSGARVVSTEAMNQFVEVSVEFLSGKGRDGAILGGRVRQGDEDGTRLGEGEGKGMEPVGEMRLHFVPKNE